MRPIRGWLMRLGELFGKSRRDRELTDEIESHLQFHIEDNLHAGLTPEEARRQAVIKLGGVEQTKEKYRDRRGLPSFESTLQDVRFALRMVRKNPGFTLVVVLTLALGIGANTAIFTVVNSVLLNPLPLSHPDRVVRIWPILPPGYGTIKGAISVADLKDWQNQNQVFEGITAFRVANLNLSGIDSPVPVVGAMVVPNFFDVMGLKPMLGRGFLDGEDVHGQEHVIVLSNSLWKSVFGANPKIIGQTILLNSESFNIVGVMAEKFRIPSANVQLWMPLVPTPEQEVSRGSHFLQAAGRMKANVTLSAAQAQMTLIMSRIGQQYPGEAFYRGVHIEGLQQTAVENVRESMLVLFAAVGLVFLVACSNVVNLLLTRTMARQREIHIRAAIGATQSRLWKQFFAESVVLSLLGLVVAWFVALWGTELVVKISPQNLANLQGIHPDLVVLGFAGVLSLLAALVMGFGMAAQSSKVNLADALKEGSLTATMGRHRGFIRNVLVVGQIGTALVLVIGALLLVESLNRLLHVDSGVRPEHVLTMRMALPPIKYMPSHPQIMFYKPALENVERIPGVQAVGVVSLLPIQSAGSNTNFQIEGRPKVPDSEAPVAEDRVVSNGYFRALSIPLERGRYLEEHDDETAPLAVVINQAFAGAYFPNEDPVGKHLQVGLGTNKDATLTIVGIVGNTRQFGLAESPHPEVDFSLMQIQEFGSLATSLTTQTMSLVVRSTGDPTSITGAVRAAIEQVDPDQPVFNVQTMEAVISTSVNDRRFNMLLLGAFAGIGLALAIIGVYGTMEIV